MDVYILQPPALETHRDIFQRYNEYGDRVAFTPATKRRPGRGGSQKRNLKPLLSNEEFTQPPPPIGMRFLKVLDFLIRGRDHDHFDLFW